MRLRKFYYLPENSSHSIVLYKFNLKSSSSLPNVVRCDNDVCELTLRARPFLSYRLLREMLTLTSVNTESPHSPLAV